MNWRSIGLGVTLVLAVAVLVVAGVSIVYLGLAAIAPGRVNLTNQGIAELGGIATAAPAAALAVLTIALVVANFRLAKGSESLARLTAQQQRDQWEPYLTSHLNQVDRNWPLSVNVTNLSTGPAIDCVYVGVFKDSYGLEMWHVTNPIDLLAGQDRQLALNRAHGFDRMTFEVSDTTTFDPDTGHHLKRTVRRSMRALSPDDSVNHSDPTSRKTSHVGISTPSGGLFTHQDGTHEEVEGRQEAIICTCANGHVHRTLPHLRKSSETFQPGDTKVDWLTWYINKARYGITIPADANLMTPEPDPIVVRTEPIG